MKKNIENNVKQILKKDGVIHNDFSKENKLVTNLKDLLKNNKNKKNWSHRLINTESNSATLICQQPGRGNRKHYHSNWNEWWLIIDGKWEFELESIKKILVKNDIILIKKNKIHKITAVGKKPAIRLAISRSDIDHIYV
jgi:quercetin dioxygenase-like cupin family protein